MVGKIKGENLNKGVVWSDKYLLPSEFNHTSLEEVLGGVIGEELAGVNWWAEDSLFNEEEENFND